MEYMDVLIDPTDREMDELISRKWQKLVGCCFEDGTFAVSSKKSDVYILKGEVEAVKGRTLYSFNHFIIFKNGDTIYINWTGLGEMEPLSNWLKKIKDEKLINFLRRVK